MTDIDDMLRTYEKHAAERLERFLDRPLRYPDDAEQVRVFALASRLRDFRSETEVMQQMRAALRMHQAPQMVIVDGFVRHLPPPPLTGEAKKADDALLALIRTTAERYGIAEFVAEAAEP